MADAEAELPPREQLERAEWRALWKRAHVAMLEFQLRTARRELLDHETTADRLRARLARPMLRAVRP